MATITTTAAPVARKPLYTSLFVQVLVALLLAIVFGMAVQGIAGAGVLKKVGRVGVKALIYFEVMTTVALVVGLLLAYLFGPGHGMNIDPATLDAKALSSYADNAHK